MICLDTQNRIAVSQAIREVSELDFSKEIRMYIKLKDNKPFLILSNALDLDLPCFGKAHVDDKCRITLPKELRKYMNITVKTNLLIYTLKGELTVEIL